MGEVIDRDDSKNIQTKHIKYLRRETLCKEGGFSSCIKIILSGYVMVLVEGPDKKSILIKILTSGELLGASAICGDATYSFSATALTDTTICTIERDTVVGLLSANGDFALKLTKWYCSNYSMLFGKIKTLGFKNLHGRMADSLLYLDSEKFRIDGIYKYLTRKDIANLAGMPMESAVRILSEFDDSNIIRIEGKEIVILDYDLLKKISRGG